MRARNALVTLAAFLTASLATAQPADAPPSPDEPAETQDKKKEKPGEKTEDPSKPEGSYLDGSGIVCLSFFCRDADRLRLRLKEAGYFVGDCFNLAPFQNPLRIFFARNVSGEIYEFLSVVRKRKESWGIPE